MKLPILESNPNPQTCQQIVCCNTFNIVKIAGRWYALDHRSADPSKFKSAVMVESWARAQGLVPKDVRNYIRRERKRRADEYNKLMLREKLQFVHASGYTVICPNGDPWLPPKGDML